MLHSKNVMRCYGRASERPWHAVGFRVTRDKDAIPAAIIMAAFGVVHRATSMKAYTKDKISENLLLVFGLCSIIISVVSLLGIWSYISDKRIIDILLAVVGAISVSLSFDRSGHFRKVDQHIEKVEKIIKRSSGGRIISGPEEIYAATIEPLNKAQQSIKAIVCGDPNKAPKRFSEAVATRLTAARDAGNPVYYQVVFATPSATSPEFLSRVSERFRTVYEPNGIAKFMDVRAVKSELHVGFDVLIIDESSSSVVFIL